MGAFSAAAAVRQFQREHAGVEPTEAARTLKEIDADFANLDFQAALALHGLIPAELSFEQPSDLRSILRQLIELDQPWWIKLFPHGRDRLVTALDENEAQCFAVAELFEQSPSYEVVAWWDAMAALARLEADASKLAQGRAAERLTLQHEADRLAAMGLLHKPRWVAMEDNSAGYDVLSYDHGEVEPIARLIEVKSTTQRPPALILSRNEWETALKFGDRYVFHIWLLPEAQLIERTTAEMAPSIPEDRGDGRWLHVRIAV